MNNLFWLRATNWFFFALASVATPIAFFMKESYLRNVLWVFVAATGILAILGYIAWDIARSKTCQGG